MSPGPGSKAQRLAAAATEAAHVRDALTHPDVVALKVERVRAQVECLIWGGMVLGLLFTMVNVQQFAAATLGAATWSLGWWAAWLLDPMVCLVLLGVLRAEQATARQQIALGSWSRAAKWLLLAATYVMNTWSSWADWHGAGIVLHSVPVLLVFLAAEAVTDCQHQLTEAVERAHTYATTRAERNAARDTATSTQEATAPTTHTDPAAPVAAAGPIGPGAVLRAVPAWSALASPDRPADHGPGRPDQHARPEPADRSADRPDGPGRTGDPDRSVSWPRTEPADRPAHRPADRSARPVRSGAGRRTGRQAAKPRSDAQLAAAVRELTEANGGKAPSQYQLKQKFGIGSGRAARLLADLSVTTGPAASPATNGAGSRKEGMR